MRQLPMDAETYLGFLIHPWQGHFFLLYQLRGDGDIRQARRFFSGTENREGVHLDESRCCINKRVTREEVEDER